MRLHFPLCLDHNGWLQRSCVFILQTPPAATVLYSVPAPVHGCCSCNGEQKVHPSGDYWSSNGGLEPSCWKHLQRHTARHAV